MRRRKRVLGLFGIALPLALASAHGCGKDPDTPTPTAKVYPRDEIDALATAQTLVLTELKEPVRVIRDKRGMIHVYARNIHDAMLAEGYMMARDRAPQMELLRRVAEGRLAELFGNLQPDLARRDITLRSMLLRRSSEEYYKSLPATSPVKEALDAYAKGVTKYFGAIRDGSAKGLPNAWLVIKREKYDDWTAIDSLAIGRLQSWGLSYTGDDEIEFGELLQKAHDTFKADASDPALAARKGFLLDAARFEPAAKRPVIDTGAPAAGPSLFGIDPPARVTTPRLSAELLARVHPALEAVKLTRDFLGKGGWSSNNWVVSPQKSASGATMVASDPHLGLAAPPIFYMAGLHVVSDDPKQQLDVAGMGFAGTPGIILGFNKHIAWGATVAVFDVNDIYRDVIKGGKVTQKGPDGASKELPIEVIEETIDYGDGRRVPIKFEKIPNHGVVVPQFAGDRWAERSGNEVLSIRWTGMEPSGEIEALYNLDRAKNVDEAIAGLAPFQAGAQNWVIGDSSGNIGYTTHSHVPVRPKGALAWDAVAMKGQLPCLVLPGDAGLEWTGKLTDAQLPHAKNPPNGYIATANSDQYGLAFDNDPSNDSLYLSCMWDPGYRQNRLRERLDAFVEGGGKLTAEDMAAIQGDAKSPLGTRLSKYFVAALKRGVTARAATTPDAELEGIVKSERWDTMRLSFVISILESWADKAAFDTPAALPVGTDAVPSQDEITASQATLVFNAAMVALFKRTLDDEWTAMGKPPWMKELQTKTLVRILEKKETLATADANGESLLWDDLTTKDVVETKDQQLLLALLDGLDHIVATYGASPDKWRWGAAHGITFTSMLPGTERQLSIPEQDDNFPDARFPRHGDEQVLDRSDFGLGGSGYNFRFTYSSGPAQRMVAVLDKSGPQVKNALPGGNVWKPGEKYFDNEAELWRKNQTAKVSFSPGEVVGEAAERWDLVPF